jgi:methylmalonyl-CoA mutase cobalamin-binding subunit
MKFSEFRQCVQKILQVDLPAGAAVLKEGRLIAENINIGRTAFMDKMGVASELEYKKQCIKDNQIMFHAHIGMSSWDATKEALALMYNAAEDSGIVIDRAGICLDRRMGLPKEHRDTIPAETGPMLETEADWRQIGQVVPIQPHMGDFMIGFPASTENTVNALKAGVTTIGNLSQFFAHAAPMWKDAVATTVETVKAIAVMGALRKQGTLMHSYLEDGYGALFCDCTTVAGWAYLENYIVENLLGAKLAHCTGGLTTDPVKRSGWIFALHEIHNHDGIGSMFYGDTLSFTPNFSTNRALVGEYLMWDIMAQLECPTGHAVLPLPITEALRVPSAEEILEAQIYGRRIEATARRLYPHVNFRAAHEYASQIVAHGKRVFDQSVDGLKEAGVDVNDPVQLLYVLKGLGPAVFEEMFGGGEPDETHARKRRPVVPTDVYEMSTRYEEKYRHLFSSSRSKRMLEGRRILIASSDVHEHAIMIINQLLAEAGAEMINLGAEVNPDEIAVKARTENVEAILVSTHNGMALDYARRLQDELQKQRVKIPVVLGGILNQKVASQALPVDVSADLKAIGFYPCPRLEGKFRNLLEFNLKPKAADFE